MIDIGILEKRFCNNNIKFMIKKREENTLEKVNREEEEEDREAHLNKTTKR